MSGRSPGSNRLPPEPAGSLITTEPKLSPRNQRVEYTHYVDTPWSYTPGKHGAPHQGVHQKGVHPHQVHQAHQVHQNHQYLQDMYDSEEEEGVEEEIAFPRKNSPNYAVSRSSQGQSRGQGHSSKSQPSQGHSGKGQPQYYPLRQVKVEGSQEKLWVQNEGHSPAISSQGHSPSSQGRQERSREISEGKDHKPRDQQQNYLWEDSFRMPPIATDTGTGSHAGRPTGSHAGGRGDEGSVAASGVPTSRGYVGAAEGARPVGRGMSPQNGSRPRNYAATNAVGPPYGPRTHTKTQGYQPGGGPTGFVIDEEASRQEGVGCCGFILTVLSWLLIIVTCPFSLCLCIKVVQEYERAVIFRLGRLMSGGAKGPGLFFVIPCMDSYTKVDLRTVSFDVPPQEVLSKDSVTVAVDAVVYYRIQNATISVTNVEDAARSTRLLAATNLRNVLGTKNLSEILADRENISHRMQVNLDEATDPWGVKVERVEIKDVRLPVQLQRAMAAEAEAAREARAKVIAAEGEHKAARALKDAADVISESPSALQLRYLQTLNTISAEKNSTIIFPLPIDLLKSFMGDKNQTQNKND